jgi:L-iditol 2-dehydrogenase
MDVAGRLLAAERLDLASSVTHRFGLENIDEAFATAVATPDALVRAVVTMSDPLDPMTAPTSGPNR